jgi:glycosyltransferase involved in cell wall biosynthesis
LSFLTRLNKGQIYHECIAQNIIRALNHPNLEEIAQNARALVEMEFTYEKAVGRYQDILNTLK